MMMRHLILFVVDVDGKDKRRRRRSAAEEYVALFRRLCFEDAADAARFTTRSVSRTSSPSSLTASNYNRRHAHCV
jgi:hypothetical protein